ncbi:MAG TPA: LytTR family DNA-binding domain-containing protein, partial [Candidatus Limiplasma sp.]|nr:LytTR family DNA-binding domain-containing protein [Candidatus Limiplasma sp.]
TTVLYTKGDGRFVTGDALGEMEERLPKDVFFRCHKSYIVNLNHIKDITPYGRWTYVVRLDDTKHDALITHDKYEELEQIFR